MAGIRPKMQMENDAIESGVTEVSTEPPDSLEPQEHGCFFASQPHQKPLHHNDFNMFASFLRRVQPIRGARSFSALVIKENHPELPGVNTGVIQTELKGRKVVICQPPRNTMQSGSRSFCFITSLSSQCTEQVSFTFTGTGNTEPWCLKFEHTGHWYNPLMGK
jgi:hypothetical protein